MHQLDQPTKGDSFLTWCLIMGLLTWCICTHVSGSFRMCRGLYDGYMWNWLEGCRSRTCTHMPAAWLKCILVRFIILSMITTPQMVHKTSKTLNVQNLQLYYRIPLLWKWFFHIYSTIWLHKTIKALALLALKETRPLLDLCQQISLHIWWACPHKIQHRHCQFSEITLM